MSKEKLDYSLAVANQLKELNDNLQDIRQELQAIVKELKKRL
jgi:hypothetical protein